MPETRRCGKCEGTGTHAGKQCVWCQGTGRETYNKHADAWPDWDGWTRMTYLREAAGLTRREVAERGKISMSWVAKVESGSIRNPQIGPLLAWAAAVGVSPSTLF